MTIRRRLAAICASLLFVSVAAATSSSGGSVDASARSFDASASTTAPVDTVPASTTLDTIPPGGSAAPVTTESPVALTGPTVTVTPLSAKVGGRVLFTAKGFRSGAITATVCGNNALRGSVDCDQPHAVSMGLPPGQQASEYVVVAHPPMPCPCVIRVTSDTGDEVATTPLKVIGHKVAPLVAPPPANVDNSLLQLTITAVEVPQGVWKGALAGLGGSLTYDVVVSVQNKTDANLHDLVASGAVGRDANDTVQAFDLAQIPPLPPGFVWRQKMRITLPAPTIGDYHWRLSVSHNGVPVTQDLVTRHRPWLLIVLVLFIIADVAALVIRGRLRARAKREAAAAAVDTSAESSPELVGAQLGS
jgi:hypothetical protein